MRHLTMTLVPLLLSGCLTEADITKLYETSVGTPDSGADTRPHTDGPSVDQPQGDGPTSDVPTTDAPTTDAPKTDAPTTDAPKTDLPKPDLIAPDQGPPPLGAGNARLLYGDNIPSVLHRTWSPTSGWSPPTSFTPTTKTVVWTLNQVSPKVAGDEAALVFTFDASSTELRMMTRGSAAGWSKAWSSTSISLAEHNKRGFDLAYEQASGDLLVVYSNNTDTPRYRTRTAAGSWSAEKGLPLNDGASFPNPDVNSGKVLWIELVPRPGSNEVALLYADANADLVVVVWDGSQWKSSAAKALELDLKQNPNSGTVHQRCFDGAYEGKTGDLLVAWGRSKVDGFFSSWLSTTTGLWNPLPAFTNTTGEVDFVDLEGQAGNDLIAGVFIDEGGGIERLMVATWDGTKWVDAKEIDSQIRDVNDKAYGDFPAAVGWVSNTTAVAVYPDNQTGTLDWAAWATTSTTGWLIQLDVPILNKGYTESVLLARVPGKNELMLVYTDSTSKLGWGVFNGSSWSMSTLLSPNVAALDSMPFSLAFQK
jgi:hypothetical protein